MSGIRVIGTGRSVPARVVTNREFALRLDTSDEWITTRTGIRERRYCTEESHTSLCVEAAARALAAAGKRPEEVGACIVATVSGDWLTPSAACLVQQALGLPEDIPCFDLNAACSGFLYALHTIECLLAAGERKVGLVIGCEVLSRLVDGGDRSTCILFGDGAGAAAVESCRDLAPMPVDIGARGEARVLRIPGPGRGEAPVISMEGAGVFRFAVDIVPKCMDRVLVRAGMGPDEVDLFVFHQANGRIIDHVVKKKHLPLEKCYKNMDRYGNTSAASVPIALDELCRAGRIRPGMRVLCVGFGGGLTWAGALVEFGPGGEKAVAPAGKSC